MNFYLKHQNRFRRLKSSYTVGDIKKLIDTLQTSNEAYVKAVITEMKKQQKKLINQKISNAIALLSEKAAKFDEYMRFKNLIF